MKNFRKYNILISPPITTKYISFTGGELRNICLRAWKIGNKPVSGAVVSGPNQQLQIRRFVNSPMPEGKRFLKSPPDSRLL